MYRQGMHRRSGVALILTVIVGAGLLMLSYLSVQFTLVQGVTRTVQHDVFMARQIADSAASQALARIKESGVLAPVSGSGTAPAWIDFSEGSYYYYTIYDSGLSVSTIRAWGRVPSRPNPFTSDEAPDSPSFDASDWTVKGLEITVKGWRYIPEEPLYFGNGGIERPAGGFEWDGDSDPADPSTWGLVTSAPSSWQDSSVPFQASALDHPPDFLSSGDGPALPSYPHPYKVFTTQNSIGQANIEAWFENSAGAGNNPKDGVTPSPMSNYYDMADSSSPNYPFAINTRIPDVQTFSWELWSRFKDDPTASKLDAGTHAGTYGDLANPGVTFVTGELRINPNTTFKGAGILVIRDDYDPNVDTNNEPVDWARLEVRGTFEWTGLVIVAGWKPEIWVRSPQGSATIVGALFGEDSVQSGGEISLDSATIITKIDNDFRVLFSRSVFEEGGIVYQFLPPLHREVVGITNL